MSTSSDTSNVTDEMNRLLAHNWWAIALRGVLGVLFGLAAFIFPGPTMLSIVWLFAIYMLIDGVFAIVAAVRAAGSGRRWGALVAEGLVDIAAGVVAAAWPGITVVAFILVVAAWAIVSGVLMLSAAFRVRGDHGKGWLIVGGIASLLYGVLLVIAPLVGAVVLTWWIGAYALVFGVSLLIAAFRLRACYRGDRSGYVAQRA